MMRYKGTAGQPTRRQDVTVEQKQTVRQRVVQAIIDAGDEGISMSGLKGAVGANPGSIRNAVQGMLIDGTLKQEVRDEIYGPTRRIWVADQAKAQAVLGR